LEEKSFPLALAPAYNSLEVVEVTAGHALKCRLCDMGVVPGAEIRLVSPETTGPVIIEVKGSRLALGRGVAQRVMVIDRLNKTTE